MPSDRSAPEVKPLAIEARRTTMIDGSISMGMTTARKPFEKRLGFQGHSPEVAHPTPIARRIAQIKVARTLAKITTTSVKTPQPSSVSLTKAAG